MLIVAIILLTIITIIYFGHDGWIYKSSPDFFYPKPYQHVSIMDKENVVYVAIYHPDGFWIVDKNKIDDSKIIAWKSKSC